MDDPIPLAFGGESGGNRSSEDAPGLAAAILSFLTASCDFLPREAVLANGLPGRLAAQPVLTAASRHTEQYQRTIDRFLAGIFVNLDGPDRPRIARIRVSRRMYVVLTLIEVTERIIRGAEISQTAEFVQYQRNVTEYRHNRNLARTREGGCGAAIRVD
jgi:hypothetical protein